MLIQNNVEICASVMDARWTVAEDSPKSRNRPNTPVKAVTMLSNPKSFGSRSRANIIKEPIRSRKFAAWAHIRAKPPRIVFSFRPFIACQLRSLASIQHAVTSKYNLPAVESLGVPARRIALHPSQPHQREQCVLVKPALAGLGREGVRDELDFVPIDSRLQRHKERRLA